MSPKLFIVDAFAERPFAGNPAAVCLLEESADARWMQSVAAEMNLSETAFVHPIQSGYQLRWFTPRVEVELCGHATLAAAHVLWETGRVRPNDSIEFSTLSGRLVADQDESLIRLDFPATPAEPAELDQRLKAALGVNPIFVGRNAYDKLLVVEREEAVLGLKPDFSTLAAASVRGVIVTAKSDDERFDFVSRFFAPAAGVDEDPVTGSAHCTLAPYWAEQLGKNSLVGRQASQRGGTVHIELVDDRAHLRGNAVTVVNGQLSIGCE